MRYLFLLATLVPILSVWANEPLHDTLRTAVVTSRPLHSDLTTRSPQQTLTAEDLSAMGVVDMPGALRRMAGVNLRDYGGAGGLKTVSVRGLGAAHTIVTYDGLAVGDARQGQTDLSRFSLDNISALRLVVGDGADLLTPVRNLGASTLDLQPNTEATPHDRRLVKDVINAFCERENKTLVMVTHYKSEYPECINKSKSFSLGMFLLR